MKGGEGGKTSLTHWQFISNNKTRPDLSKSGTTFATKLKRGTPLRRRVSEREIWLTNGVKSIGSKNRQNKSGCLEEEGGGGGKEGVLTIGKKAARASREEGSQALRRK